MGISLSATPILPVVDLPKLIHEIIMLLPGTRSLGYLTLGIALLRSEFRTPLVVLSATTPLIRVLLVRVLLVRVLLVWVALLLLGRIIRLPRLRCRRGDTGDIWQRDRDPRLLLRRRERTPQDRRNCPNKNDTKRRAGSRSKIELHVTPPPEAPQSRGSFGGSITDTLTDLLFAVYM
jgi:hypothetical protein